ncbi:MAG: polysaccharide biosynthesis tyrosine autokinase [Agriterribacter sp.]
MHTNSTFFQSQTNTVDTSADIKLFFQKIFQSWRWILMFMTGMIILAYLYGRYAEPVYRSQASVMIKDEKKGGAGLLDNPLLKELDMGGGGKLVENEIEVLQSYDLMESVVRKEQLFLNIRRKGKFVKRSVFDKEVPFSINVINPDTLGLPFQWIVTHNDNNTLTLNYGGAKDLNITAGKEYIINGLKFVLSNNYAFNSIKDSSNNNNEYILSFISIKLAVDKYTNALNVTAASKNATIINLELRDHNEIKAVRALNSLISIYNRQALEDKNKVTSNTLNFLNGRLAIMEGELRTVEGQVQQLKSNNRITDISAEAQQYADQAKEVDYQKAQQQTQLNILASVENNLKSNQEDAELVPSGAGVADAGLNLLMQDYNNLVLQYRRQSEKLGGKHPMTVDLRNQIANTRQSLLGNISNLKQNYRINLNDLSGKDAELNARIRSIPKIEKNLVQIKRDQSVKEQIYFLLLQKKEESSITLASATADSRNVERPRSAGIVSPKKGLIFIIALLFGALIPIGIIYIRGILNNKIESKDEVERKCKAPVIGEISYVRKNNSPIVIQKASRSIVAEQFRAIRTNISFTRTGNETKNILVTSHRPSEGKSFTSLNLAATYALLNKKVVVLEFDLRKPRLSSTLSISSESGISTYLSSPKMDIDVILKEVPGFEKRFWLLPAGPIPPNPAELILGDRIKSMMEELNEKFDYIILDTPPYSLVTDSSLLAHYADISVVVLRQGFTFEWVLRELNKKIDENPSQPLYTIINRVGEKSYYGNYRKYGYGYSEYFDVPVKNKKWWQFWIK